MKGLIHTTTNKPVVTMNVIQDHYSTRHSSLKVKVCQKPQAVESSDLFNNRVWSVHHLIDTIPAVKSGVEHDAGEVFFCDTSWKIGQDREEDGYRKIRSNPERKP